MQNWIVIADAASVRIFAVNQWSTQMQLVRAFRNPRSRIRRADIASAEPGRIYKSGGTVRSAADPRTDPHDVEVHRFARRLAITVRQASDRKQFDELVIIAAPRFFGVLRRELGKQARKHLRACVAMNCSKVGTAELSKQLKHALPDFFGTACP